MEESISNRILRTIENPDYQKWIKDKHWGMMIGAYAMKVWDNQDKYSLEDFEEFVEGIKNEEPKKIRALLDISFKMAGIDY